MTASPPGEAGARVLAPRGRRAVRGDLLRPPLRLAEVLLGPEGRRRQRALGAAAEPVLGNLRVEVHAAVAVEDAGEAELRPVSEVFFVLVHAVGVVGVHFELHRVRPLPLTVPREQTLPVQRRRAVFCRARIARRHERRRQRPRWPRQVW